MSTFNVEKETITAFDIGDSYIFKAYFDEDQLYRGLQTYYNKKKYCFEIPESYKDKVEQIIERYIYELEVTDDIENYCVVIEREADSSNILRNSVMREPQRENEIFLMKDQLSVRQAVENGAVPIQKSEVQKEEIVWRPQGP